MVKSSIDPILTLALLRGRLDRGDEALGGGRRRDLADDDGLLVLALDPRPHPDLAAPVVVLADIHEPAGGEVGEELDGLLLEDRDLRLEQLGEVVRQDLGRHADGDALGAGDQQDRELGRQDDRLFVATVVGRPVLGEGLVEEGLAGELGQPALDVARRRGAVAGEDVAEVALALDEVVLVGQHDEGVADRGVAVRVELHRVADDVGDLVEAAVVHLGQRRQDAPLHRLEAVAQIGDRAVEDDVARVLDEVLPHQRFDFGHDAPGLVRACVFEPARTDRTTDREHVSHAMSAIRFSMMKSLRAGVFLPMKKSRRLLDLAHRAHASTRHEADRRRR